MIATHEAKKIFKFEITNAIHKYNGDYRYAKDHFYKPYENGLGVYKSSSRQLQPVLEWHHEELFPFDNQPTCYNLTLQIVPIPQNEMLNSMILKSVKIYETASYAQRNNPKL